MSDVNDLKAKIAKLRRVAEHPNTLRHEAEAARNRIKALEAKLPPEPVRYAKRNEDAWSKVQEAMRKAAEADQRTRQQRQRDMDDRSRRERDAWVKEMRAEEEERLKETPGCKDPETFFTPGGIPRQRNTYPIDCDKCGKKLAKGEGSVFQVGGVWYGRCTEKTPGPRRKRW